ncbi:MAG TPA: TetR family transcriptional regulator, partial [Candidatus Polarisedimenticolia bacterium]|nr:TetR family transcriptional regulator [Candidatus Polarisedimenticolia bacterium]
EVISKRSSDRTREALIGAATDLFAEKGFDGATVEMIARRARVNKAMINYHFGGKSGLYQAILSATFTPAIERLAAIESSPLPVGERLRNFVDLFVETTSRRPQLPAMILREVLTGGRRLGEPYLEYLLANFRVVRGIVEQGMRDGVFRPVDPFLTHLSLVGSLVFFMATTPVRDRLITERRIPVDPPSMADFARHLLDLMTRGLAPSGPGGPLPRS